MEKLKHVIKKLKTDSINLLTKLQNMTNKTEKLFHLFSAVNKFLFLIFYFVLCFLFTTSGINKNQLLVFECDHQRAADTVKHPLLQVL